MSFFKHEQALVSRDAKVGDDTRVWAFAHIQAGAIVGKECNICDGSFVEKGAVVGNNVTVKHHVSIFDGVTIEDGVFIGSNIAFINDRYPRSQRHQAWRLEKTTVKKGSTLGANAVILCGLTIGEYAFIAAGAVVTKDVAPYVLMVGNPARVQGYVCQCGDKLKESLKCECGLSYRKEGEGLVCDV